MDERMLDYFAECTCVHQPLIPKNGPMAGQIIAWERIHSPDCVYHNPPRPDDEAQGLAP